MKNLYIYSIVLDLEGKNKITKEVWEDVCKTRDGEIVKKRDKEYNLSRGNYKDAKQLNQYIVRPKLGGGFSEIITYFSFEDDVDKSEFLKIFIEERKKEIERLAEEILDISMMELEVRPLHFN